MIVKTFEQFITEGINDPNILKAVFLAGGPGSGKSYAAKRIFGIDDNISSRTSSLGLKVLNSDVMFEFMLDKDGLKSSDLMKMSPEEFKKYTMGPESKRGFAKNLTKKQLELWIAGRLGIIIDGTGKDYGKIAKMKKKLEDIGYDTNMVFVNTSLPVAQERNQMRDRTLPTDMVEEMWDQVQQNIGKFQSLFKNNMVIVDNSEVGDFNKMHGEKIKAIEKLVKSPVKNTKGKAWMKSQRV